MDTILRRGIDRQSLSTSLISYDLFQNYDKINGKVGPKSQEIFDLLKVVHTLKTQNNNFSAYIPFAKKIRKIESKEEYSDKHLKQIKLKNYEKLKAIQSIQSNLKQNNCKS